MAINHDYMFKLLLTGDSCVGKSPIISRFCEDFFSFYAPPTIGADFKIKDIDLKGKKIKLQIWDFSGYEIFQQTISSCHRIAHGVMLVYDISDEMSFQHIKLWLKKVEMYAVNCTNVMLVGNKCDLEEKRQVSQDRAREFALSHGMNFFEVSAKESINIEEAFITFAADILAYKESQPLHLKTNIVLHTNESGKQGSKDTNILKRIFYPIFGGKTQTPSVPEEIADDPYTLDMYGKALRGGTEIDRSIRINVVGNFGQGKTSVVRRLLEQKTGDVESTDGIDIYHYMYHRSADRKLSFKKAWEKDTSNIIDRLVSVALRSEHTQEKKLTSSVIYERDEALHASKPIPTPAEMSAYDRGVQPCLDRKTEIKSSSFDKNVRSFGNDLESSSEENSTKVIMLSEKERGVFSKELKKKRSQNSSQEIKTVFDIWDFGGQHVYYATHTLFHSKRAIYLLVIDLSKGLDEVVDDKEFPEESSDKCLKYFLHFWMNSIHSFVGSEDGSEPRVILVGTHKDKVEGNEEAKRQYIENYFDKVRTAFDGTSLLRHIHTVDFAVDNTVTNDEAIVALRDTIISMGNEQSSLVELPAKWIHLEKALNERKHEKIVQLELVLEIDAANEVAIGDTEQIKFFLRYHHSKGTFVYFEEEPLSKHVVLDPQYLVDAFKCIITSERFCTHDPDIRPLWKRLMTDARLEQSLIDNQWGKDADQLFMKYKAILLAFLTKHHIISEATHYDDTAQQSVGLGWFVVPSLLNAQIPQTELRRFLIGKKQTSLRFVMLFDNSAIVPTIYHRLMAAQIGKWSITQIGSRNLISKDQCIFQLNVDHAGMTGMRHDTIELTVINLCPSSGVSGDQADIFRRFSEAVVIHEFSKLHRNKEARYKPHTIQYRCNHQSHDVTGSFNVISADTLNEQLLVPCPDSMSHDIQATKAKSEWTKDFKEKVLVTNPELSDKVLSRVSCCIGKNWQLLGLELGVSQVKIEQITEDHPNSVAMKIYCMLKTWCLKMEDSADMNVLVQKMQERTDVTIDWDEIRNIVDDMK